MPRGSHRLWALAGLGLLGSLLIAYAAPGAVDDAAVSWWYTPSFPSGRGVSVALVYAGMVLLSLAWLGLGRIVATRGARAQGPGPANRGTRAQGPGPATRGVRTAPAQASVGAPTRRDLLIIGALWLLPLAAGPALFSRDVYSYLAQGTLLNLGHNPYQATPALLGQFGQAHVLHAVSPFWRHTPAPYGPLFLQLINLIVAIAGSHLIVGVLLVRGLDLIGVALLVAFLPRLARALGTDEARATWLILSPLVMLELIAAGHNDVLMIGLLVAGVAVALEGRPLGGIALCALAATVKVPALAGAVFIAVAWTRAETGARARARFLAGAALVAVLVLAAVSLATGLGVSWLTSTVFSTPAKVHLAITPATAIGATLADAAHALGLGVSPHGLEAAFGVLTALITAAVGLVLLYRVRVATLVVSLGAFLIAAAAGGPAAWPWYFAWGLVLLAACAGPQRCTAVALATVPAAFLVKPNGILALPIAAAPLVILAYAAIAAVLVLSRRRRRHPDCGVGGGDDGGGARAGEPGLGVDARSALIRT